MHPVDLRFANNVARIEFGDPAERNVLDERLLEALVDALHRAQESARVVVLSGRGNLWSAGYDVSQIPAALFAEDAATVAAHPFERCMRALQECPLPTIAALCGAVFGGALELAVSCDLRLASAETHFGFTPARLGIVYSHTGLEKLSRLLGPAHARLLVFTGRSIEARLAERIGLVNQVCETGELDAGVQHLADEIAACAPLAVQGMKRVLGLVERGAPLSVEELQSVLRLRHRAFTSADFAEGRAAFAAKRPPYFEGR